MRIFEFRIPIPVSVDEWDVAYNFTISKTSRLNTKGGAGYTIEVNEPWSDAAGHPGHHTVKIMHLGDKLPRFISSLLAADALKLREESWSPSQGLTRTVFENVWLGARVRLEILTLVLPDRGETENALGFTPDELKLRQVQTINIATDKGSSKEYVAAEDPSVFKSVKTGRGPLAPDFAKTSPIIATVYKAVKFEFRVFGLQTAVESYAGRLHRDVFLGTHKQVFCWIDDWFGMTPAQLKAYEDETARITSQNLQKPDDAAASSAPAPAAAPEAALVEAGAPAAVSPDAPAPAAPAQ